MIYTNIWKKKTIYLRNGLTVVNTGRMYSFDFEILVKLSGVK